MKYAACLITLVLFAASLNAQELYMPRNVKNAYEKGTRSISGAPGNKYWQNKGIYDISLEVDPDSKTVTGKETITYLNNSPDTLSVLNIRFVNNIHKPQSPRSGYVSKEFLSTGMNISRLQIGTAIYEVNNSNWGTTEDVKLQQVLLPGAQIQLIIEWSYPLSIQSGREGQIDPDTYFMAYAYPRISVYDDYNGWDRVPHRDDAEFYNDFNDYTVSVTIPKNYVVWGTGDLLNPEEVLQDKILKRYKQSLTSDKVLNIATAAEMKAGGVTKQSPTNTWKFSASNITDVTFGTSNHYIWDGSSVIVDPRTKRRASMQAAYKAGTEDFTHVVKWGREALSWFSTNMPGIPYPFSKMTAFQGFANMEYPMMVNDSEVPDHIGAQYLLNHEVAHTWFPFYMGTNETRYAFMDEGWAVVFEYLIGINQYGLKKANERQGRRVSNWALNPAAEHDQPIISMSGQVQGAGYRTNAYGKPSMAYLALRDMLGAEKFRKVLHSYMDLWNGKHPIPWDFFHSINQANGEDLNWFWNNWFFSNNFMDLTLGEVANRDSVHTIYIRNKGGFAVPFDLTITYTDGSTETIHNNPSIWKRNQKEAVISVGSGKQLKTVMVDTGIFLDADLGDNRKDF